MVKGFIACSLVIIALAFIAAAPAPADTGNPPSAYATVQPGQSGPNPDSTGTRAVTWISAGAILSGLVIIFVFRPLKPSSLAP